MDMIKGFVFIILMLVLPILLGRPLVVRLKSDKESLSLSYVAGILIMFSVFYLLELPMMLTDMSFTVLCILWSIIMYIFLVYGIIVLGKDTMILLKRRLFQKDVYLLVFILMVLSQAVFCCVFMHADGDDAQYVAMATTVLQTDRLSGVLPSTGGETIFGLQAQYYLAPFPYFWALWGKFLNLHPAILMHTFLPAVLIVFAYAVYSLVARQLFEGIQKRYFFLYVLCVCNVWGNYSIRTSASYLLLRPWQGKAMLTAAFIPLLMYLAVRLSKAGADLIDWSLLLLSCIATCLISGMSFILVPLFLGMVTVFEFIENKSVKAVIRYLSCMVPYFIVFIIYYVKRV